MFNFLINKSFILQRGIIVQYLLLENIDRIVNTEVHLKNINLEFKAGSRYILLGRTLAGKTSLLRLIAGLDRPTSGRLFVDKKDVTGVSVRKRSIAMVYQQFINYPSMTVFDNIASPLKLSKIPRDEIENRVRETAEMLHIEPLLDRLPAELSGGQQQRTAIARALVRESDILLLDEPLVNLDYKLREELREELQDIFSQRKSIVIYTTTEPAEALMLGGDIIVLDEGRVIQEGKTPTVFRQPASIKVSQVFSDPPVNLINGSIRDGKAYMGDYGIPINGHLKTLKDGDFTFGIRPNHLFLDRKSPEDMSFVIKVELSELSGSESFIHASFLDTPIVVQEDGVHNHKFNTLLKVYVNFENVIAFNPSGELVAAPPVSE